MFVRRRIETTNNQGEFVINALLVTADRCMVSGFDTLHYSALDLLDRRIAFYKFVYRF